MVLSNLTLLDVVRAVAGLLHYIDALTSAGTAAFHEDYAKALKIYEATQRAGKLGPGKVKLPSLSGSVSAYGRGLNSVHLQIHNHLLHNTLSNAWVIN